jgi:hypothetical protein
MASHQIVAQALVGVPSSHERVDILDETGTTGIGTNKVITLEHLSGSLVRDARSQVAEMGVTPCRPG